MNQKHKYVNLMVENVIQNKTATMISFDENVKNQ